MVPDSANIRQLKVRADCTVTYSVVSSLDSEPSTHVEAMTHPLWRQAMDEEYHALLRNHTWHLVPSRPGLNIIDCKWVFKLKRKPDGSVDRYKARLVAKGFKQQYRLDYGDSLVLLLSLLQFEFYCLLLFLEDGIYTRLIFKMLSCMAWFMRTSI